VRLKTNGSPLDASTGDKGSYYPFVHTLDALIPHSLFATHPEYFPLIDGKRANGDVQRCLSNPDVLRLAIKGVRHWIKEEPEALLYSVSQNDNKRFCSCSQCQAIEARHGGQHSGRYLWFVNQVAEVVAREHPDKLIDTRAYQFTEALPTGIKPRKNVRVRLCPFTGCEAHPYEHCSDANNVAFVRNLLGRLGDSSSARTASLVLKP
jgi:hypothetical protein